MATPYGSCTAAIQSITIPHVAALHSSCSIFGRPACSGTAQSLAQRFKFKNQCTRRQCGARAKQCTEDSDSRKDACTGEAGKKEARVGRLQRRELMKRVLVGGLAGAAGVAGVGPQDLALADVWSSAYDVIPVATKAPPAAPVKYRETKNATPFTITYPDRFVEALNRKPGTEVSKDDGEETLALIGDFKTFDTVSVLRYPIAPGTPGTVSAEEISQKLIIGGNIATEFLRKDLETPDDPSQGNKYHFEYVTEQCRGEVVEGLRGRRECFRGENVLPTITRHHYVNVEAFKGYFYVVTASAAQTRWADAKSEFEQILSSFKLSEPPAPPSEA